MIQYIIAFSSITIANKAKGALAAEGISSDIMRTPKNLASGCGYSIITGGDIEDVMAALERRQIRYKSVMER